MIVNENDILRKVCSAPDGQLIHTYIRFKFSWMIDDSGITLQFGHTVLKNQRVWWRVDKWLEKCEQKWIYGYLRYGNNLIEHHDLGEIAEYENMTAIWLIIKIQRYWKMAIARRKHTNYQHS